MRPTRTHPLTATLVEALVEASLEPETLPGLGIGRVGAWPTPAVEKPTRLVLLRIRYKLSVHARKERLLLAEEAALVALQGATLIAVGEAACRLLDTPPAPISHRSPASVSSLKRVPICLACWKAQWRNMCATGRTH